MIMAFIMFHFLIYWGLYERDGGVFLLPKKDCRKDVLGKKVVEKHKELIRILPALISKVTYVRVLTAPWLSQGASHHSR